MRRQKLYGEARRPLSIGWRLRRTAGGRQRSGVAEAEVRQEEC